MIVAKFGGTALSDSKNWEKVLNISNDKERKVIVLSAPGSRYLGDKKVTDLLIEYYSASDDFVKKKLWQEIAARYLNIATSFGVNADNLLEETRLLTIDAPKAFVISRGEYLSAKLFSMITKKRYVESAKVVKFDCNGKLMQQLTEQLICDICKENTDVCVLGGFYGSDNVGNVVLFDRGGSDVTGALVASALNADLYENWTDVSGFFVCDPRIVLNPTKISCLSFEQLKILSTLGASVLHPQSVYPAQLKNIPINIKSIFKPQDSGTFVTPITKKSNEILGITATEATCIDCISYKKFSPVLSPLFCCYNCGFWRILLKKGDFYTPNQYEGIVFQNDTTLVSVLVDGSTCLQNHLTQALNKVNLPCKILCDDFGLCMCMTLPNNKKQATKAIYEYFFN